MRLLMPIGAAVLAAGLGLGASAASAASAIQKECSQKYQAAKAANTLNGMKYKDYYKQCSAAAKAMPAPATTAAPTPAAAPAPAPAPAPMQKATAPAPAPAMPMPKTAAKPMAPAAAPVAVGNAVFPGAISAQFASESAGKARMHTCLAQYNANKTTNGNGGLRWIEKGGGYYSECNKHLKG